MSTKTNSNQNPPVVKLTPTLLKLLRLVVERDEKGTWSKRHARLQELNRLHKLGYVEPVDSEPDWHGPNRAESVCYISTPAGRAALRAADAASSAVPCPVCGGKGFFDTFDERNTTHSTETCEACGGSGHVTPARAKELKDAMYPFDAESSAAPAPKDGGR